MASASSSVVQSTLKVLHYASPLILLFFFLFAFTLRSVWTASTTNNLTPSSAHTGPGGKPLPKKTPQLDKKSTTSLDFSRSRKLLFDWLSVAAATTFVANAINVIAHALIHRRDGWWCGKSVVVGRVSAMLPKQTGRRLIIYADLHRRILFRVLSLSPLTH